MRGLFIFATFLALALCHGRSGIAQRMLTIRSEKPVICYQSFENRPDHVAVSDEFRQMRQRGNARTKTSTIDVEYISFPADGQAKAAFQYAVEIWESELTSSIPIRIQADWRKLDAGVLGQAVWGTAHANFGGEQHMNVFYPVSLAEKIAGVELNAATEPDIVASFNSSASWYFGTDGKTPAGKMDMVTIVLHEIAHGLGFTDTYDVAGSQGSVGLANGGESVPFVFDVFVENEVKANLLHDFQSPSTQLAAALQSAELFFNGPLAGKALNGQRPELYAPSPFDKGSSISHLDETIFNSQQDANRLMTPQIAFAESIHDPGNLLLGMLADIGWVYTKIDHTPLTDTERRDGQPYIVTARIRSDNGYDPASVKLHYTIDGTNFTVVSMTGTGQVDQFQASLPGRATEWAYAYYISVNDIAGRTFTSPGKTQTPGKKPEQATHFFRIGPDATAPVIVHEPVQFLNEGSNNFKLTAEVSDNLGVEEVLVEYSLNAGAIQTQVMQRQGSTNDFTITIAVPVLDIDDALRYRIIARDLASNENVTTDPADDFFIVEVTGIMPVQESYSNDFNSASNDFFGPGFRVATPAGFQNGAIHTDHPYNNGSGPDNESNYSYQLQIPVRINNVNPVIKFDEIVLVEPGEEGSIFGGDGFFDYVIVEGSIDEGATWEPFGPGYDSRANDVWLNRYNANVTNDDSQSLGDPALFRQRAINMLENGNFFVGDEVLIRFRLFADQFAHGWGWAIDNLSIQTPITSLERPLSGILKVYPVPATNELFVEMTEGMTGPVQIEISDAAGSLVYQSVAAEETGPLTKKIDVQFLAEGFYILRVRAGENVTTRKFLKRAE